MRFSVIVLGRGDGAAVGRTLDALRGQVGHDLEVIVAGAEPPLGSTDCKIIPVVEEDNPAALWNRAAAHAAGEALAFVEAGAMPEPQWLEAFAAALNGAAAVGGSGGPDGEPWALCDRRGFDRGGAEEPVWPHSAPSADVFLRLPPHNCCFRRECFVELGGLDEDLPWPLPLAGICARLLDRGWEMRHAPGAVVRGISAPRWPRLEDALADPASVVRAAAIFALRHSPHEAGAAALRRCHEDFETLLRRVRQDRSFPKERRAALEGAIERGLWSGAAAGHARPRRPHALSAPQKWLPFAASSPRVPAVSAGQGPLTVSLVTGLIVPRDAISNICREQLEALSGHTGPGGRPVRVQVYALACVPGDPRVVTADSADRVAADEHFNASDVIHYHAGVYYPLFDSIHLAPRRARISATFHGITPPHLVPDVVRPSLQRAYRQAANLLLANTVVTTSPFLARELRRMGVHPGRIAIVPLPAAFERSPDPSQRPPRGPDIRLAYVGRLVPAKGLHDLIDAAAEYARRGSGPLKVDLVGSKTFSDRVYLDRLVARVAEEGLGDTVRFHFDAPEEELQHILLSADAVVIPSMHEGFCVPVIEALAAGCFVICSDAGALPETAGGLGRTYPAGDAGALRRRIAEFAAARARGGVATDGGFLTHSEWAAKVAEYLPRFTRARYQDGFRAALFDGVEGLAEESRAAVMNARRQAMTTLFPAAAPCRPTVRDEGRALAG